MSGRRRDAIALLLVALITGGFALWLVHQGVNSFTLQVKGDQVWVQASAQMAMQSGPFAVNDHVGWSTGLGPWNFPAQASLGFLVLAWALGLVTDSSSNVLAAIMAVTAAAVGIATYLAARIASPGRVSRIVAVWIAIAIGASPYVLGKMGHYNVAALYLLPALLAFLAYVARPVPWRNRLIAAAVLAVVAVLSPLWWDLVALFLLGIGLLVALVLRSRTWIRTGGLALLAVGAGTLVPVVLTAVSQVGPDTWNRQPWDSRVFSGSLTDFLLSSPLLTEHVEHLAVIQPGASAELSQVGLLPGLGALAALLVAVTAYLGFSERTRRDSGWLLVTLQITLLTFLTLGLGTFAESLLALLDQDFPLRVWARLTILIALIGLLLVAPWVTRSLDRLAGALRLVVVAALSVVVVGLVVGDAVSFKLSEPRTLPSIEEGPALDFLSGSVDPCPVAQLPVGTFPDFPMNDGTPRAIDFYYRGFVPYLLRPEFSWSFGAVAGTPTDVLMRGLPAAITAPDLLTLQDAGYCAVLYDREYAEWLRATGATWAGQEISAGTPDWQGGRFDVYLLD